MISHESRVANHELSHESRVARHAVVLATLLVFTIFSSAQTTPKRASKNNAPNTTQPNANAAPAGPIAIRGAKLLTITNGVIENGTIVMENGKITAVGGAGTAVPRNARVIEGAGMTVYPGLIDSETNL